jgi:hypothetical protein
MKAFVARGRRLRRRRRDRPLRLKSRLGCGVLVWTMTVSGSGVSTAVIALKAPPLAVRMAPLVMLRMDHATSAEVRGWPSWK